MGEHSALIRSLTAAVASAPEDVPLRLHLAELLLGAGDVASAVSQLAAVLQRDPSSAGALSLMHRATTGPAQDTAPLAGAAPPPPVPGPPLSPPAPAGATAPAGAGFDWTAAEGDLSGVVEPMFVEGAAEPGAAAYDVERSSFTLADVAGLDAVKDRLQAAFLAPMRNPELRALYGKSLRGGLMLYGPPGCGKTFVARALAGELGASFLPVGLADVLDMYVGQSERNLHEIFDIARRNAPCVVFFDEIDALGQKRSQLRGGAMRQTVNQLLTELDGVGADNEGVFVLASTNHPWDVDVALRRPGRFDRTILVSPPDRKAREAIFRFHLARRPVAGIDAGKLAKATEDFSGADIAHVCETAAEYAMLDSARTGQVRMIGQPDLERALTEVRPSTRPWLESARNVALYGNAAGEYDDLLGYLRKRKLL